MRTVNDLTPEQNADRLEELFSVAALALFDIKESAKSPTTVSELVEDAQKEFAEINKRWLGTKVK